MAQLNADLKNYETQEGFDPLPPGWYQAQIIDSEIKTSKAGNQYIMWTFQVIGKPHKIWQNTALGNEIAMKILKTMATCCGHKNPNYIADTEELHGKKCMIKVKIESQPGYDDKNVITAFKPVEKQQQEQPASTFVSPPQPAVKDQTQEVYQPRQKYPWEK